MQLGLIKIHSTENTEIEIEFFFFGVKPLHFVSSASSEIIL